MRKIQVIAGLLILSFMLNVFISGAYFQNRSERIELEKGIIMNEFSERARELRNFMHFTSSLSERNDETLPVTEEEASLYWELANPGQSVVIKITDKVTPVYPLYSGYTAFLRNFDREYQAVNNRFKEKLPLMTQAELVTFSGRINETYDFFMKSIGRWSISGQNLEINFEPSQDKLDQLIGKLVLTGEWLGNVE